MRRSRLESLNKKDNLFELTDKINKNLYTQSLDLKKV
jgi:hypothetical protein